MSDPMGKCVRCGHGEVRGSLAHKMAWAVFRILRDELDWTIDMFDPDEYDDALWADEVEVTAVFQYVMDELGVTDE